MSQRTKDPAAWTALLEARSAARQIFWRMKQQAQHEDVPRFKDLLGDLELLTDHPEWATLRPHLAAATALCGALMNDEDAEIQSTTVTGRLQYMVTNTKCHAQRFVYGDTPFEAVAALLRHYAGPAPEAL